MVGRRGISKVETKKQKTITTGGMAVGGEAGDGSSRVRIYAIVQADPLLFGEKSQSSRLSRSGS